MVIIVLLTVFVHLKQKKYKSHEKVSKNHDYCHIEIPGRGKNILKYNHGENSIKVPFVNLH